MHSTSGIILQREDFRERDERVLLYTRDFGKVSVVAKGARRIEAKLRGNLDILNFVDIIFVEGAYSFILCGVDTNERFPRLTQNSYAYATALSCVRALDFIFEEGEKDEEFWEVLLLTLRKINECASGNEEESALNAWLIWKKFQMLLLKNQGYERVWSNGEAFTFPRPISPNSRRLLEMLDGAEHENIRLSRKEFLSIEEFFSGIFAHLFQCHLPLWVPLL